MPVDDRLFTLLRKFNDAELDDVWKLLGKKASSSDFGKLKVEAKVVLVSKNLRSLSNFSIRDWFRGDHDYPWHEILVQIADKLSIDCKGLGDAAIEQQLWDIVDGQGQNLGHEAAKNAVLGSFKGSPLWPLARILWGPAYKKIVPAVLYIVSRSGMYDKYSEGAR